ncbi:putative quinate O-hydroxycinnamoyltransferase [Helianthus debilis subsp. tardiflorus]
MATEEKHLKVEILSKTHVKPQKPLGRKECQLVTFDLPYIAFYYNQKLLIYKGGVEEFESIVEKLKDGLKVVLEEFYQLAGKLDKDDDGVFKVVYDDDMDGVEVVTATVEDAETADLLKEEGTAKLKELLPYNEVLNFEGLHRPLLSIQLTKLKDGLAMGCAFNHAILDGTSTWHFMSSWAEICTGSKSISIQPFLDRTQARNTRVKLDLTPPEQQNAIESHDAQAIEARNKEWESNPIIFQYKDAGVNCVAVGSSPRFKVYDVDFGFGKPESVRSGANNRFDGMVYLYPAKEGGRGIDVEISLEAGAMENLEKDKEFLVIEE